MLLEGRNICNSLIAAIYVTLCCPGDKGQRRGMEQFGKPKLEYKVIYVSPKPPGLVPTFYL